ncbi:MAG: phycobiliprotein lyase [Cyanobacteria bacterium P01_A01_bin.37]
MDIKEFFEKSCGKWFSQRTSQHLTYSQSEWGKSDIYMDMLTIDDSAVVQACEQHGIHPSKALCAAQVRWEGFVGAETSKKMGLTILVPIPSDTPNQGILLRHTLKPQSFLSKAQYRLDDDEALTLCSDHEGAQSEERLWFVSDNLRLRTSVVKRVDSFDTSSFMSEIRILSS